MKEGNIKEVLNFLKKRPNRLVAFIAVLVFITILYWMSREQLLIYMGVGLAGGLFSWIKD